MSLKQPELYDIMQSMLLGHFQYKFQLWEYLLYGRAWNLNKHHKADQQFKILESLSVQNRIIPDTTQ